MGWNQNVVNNEQSIFADVLDGSYTYFVHSYYAKCDQQYVVSYTNYGVKVPSCVEFRNVYGMQFHPEKSGEKGLEMLERFIERVEEQAKAIDEAGLNALHLVDLDGAKAKHPVNTETVRKIRRNFEGYIELGGGIRTLEDISACLEIGIDRVILGSVAVTDPELVKNALQKFGEEKIAIGIDGTNDKVAVNGWLEKTEVTLEELMK